MDKDEIINTAAAEIEKELCIEQDRAKEIIFEFITTLDEQMQKIKESIHDTYRMKHLAHSLKGTSANLRLNDLYEAAKNLDTAAKEKDSDKFDYLVYQLSIEIDRLL